MRGEVNYAHITGKAVKDSYYGKGKKQPYCFVTVVTGSGIHSCYHEVSGFGALAEEMREIKKGAMVDVEGRLSYRKREKDGVKWSEAQVVADKVHHFLPEIPQDEEDYPNADVPF